MLNFKPFHEVHLVQLRKWLSEDYVKAYWQETDDDQKLKQKFLFELPRRSVCSFIIEKNGEDIGYIQYYDAKKVGGGWWEKEPAGTFGIDLMIGVKQFTGVGLGPKVIKEFISFLWTQERGLKSIIIDPDPKNERAIRAFQKAGFSPEGEINTPGGKALLMRIRF